MTSLRQLQLRFQDYLLGAGEDIRQDIVSTDDALAEHRLGTYYNAYRIRLIDCLAVDYSALEKYLGRPAFETLVLEYLERHPSTHPSVRWAGASLPDFLRDEYRGDKREFLAELARYEWTQGLIFDAADSQDRVQLDDIAQIPPEDWPGLGFEFKPALRWLDLYWNVPAIESALDQEREPPPKVRTDYPQRWLLWRRDFKTHWRSLDVHEAWAIEAAAGNANFAEICEGLLEWVDESQVALTAAGFLKQWISDQLLLTLDPPKH